MENYFFGVIWDGCKVEDPLPVLNFKYIFTEKSDTGVFYRITNPKVTLSIHISVQR